MMIYQKARQIHRIFMFLTIFLTLIMWLTGQVMDWGWRIMTDWQARQLHRITSKFFSFSLSLMIITGLIMYFYPLIKKRYSKKSHLS